ncbi:MAG: Gfo/Idh/MocA family oxidoreductase [Pirellulales bacterium]
MNLTPEEKKIGKQNFQEAVGSTRRDFLIGLGVAGGAVATMSLGSKYFGYGPKLDERLRVGIIGTGDEGSVLIGALNPDYVDVVAIADIRPYSRYRAFHGDWYSPGAHAARPGLLKVYEKEYSNEAEARKHIKVYENDYHELLDDPNVEAVIIATPLFMHHPMAIAAMRKGKHVLSEKLMGHDVGLCKEMSRVCDASKDSKGNPIVMAVGHQRHYSILYDNAVEQIRQGLIGDIHHIRAQWHRDNSPKKDSWKPPMPGDAELAKELDSWKKSLAKASPAEVAGWEAKIAQKQAQMNDLTEELALKWGYEAKTINGYNRPALEELIRWRLWNRTAAGLMAELGSHQLDASSIFISAMDPERRHVHPLAVTALGGRSIFPNDRECEDHVYCMFEFPGKGYYKDGDAHEVADPTKKIMVTYSSINGNGYGGYGEIVFGTEGTLILEQEQEAMLFKGSSTSTSIEVKEKGGKAAMDTYETGGGAALAAATAGAGGPVSRGYKEEIEHWAWCIRNPAPEHKPHCTPVVAMGDAIIALTANQAIAKQTRIEFKPEWFDPARSETPDGSVPREAAQVT